MNLIVIDDDISTVDRIVSMVDKTKLGLDNVFSAYNAEEAKDVFREHRIDILLCDIEMPCGSGLDLIEWLNENGYDAVSILLTSYAEFFYAKKALELGSFDYLLKPAPYPDIEDALMRAIDKVRESQIISNSKVAAEYWDRNKTIVTDQFFRELVNDSTPRPMTVVTEQAYLKNIPLYADSTYTPVLIRIERRENDGEWDSASYSYAVKNIASEIIFQNDSDQFFVTVSDNSHVVILRDFTHTQRNIDSLMQRCENFIGQCERYLSCVCSCYIGLSVAINMIGPETLRIEKYADNNVSYEKGCFIATSSAEAASSYIPPDGGTWQPFVKRGDSKGATEALVGYLDSMAAQGRLDANNLKYFKYDFFQSLCLLLDGSGIQAHLLFSDQKSERLFRESGRSVAAMKQYIGHAIDRSCRFITRYQKPQTLIEEIEEYIQANYNGNISRETISELFFFTPDHINRLFKKKYGVTISKYIFDLRIARAKELLSETELSVGEISDRTGFSYVTYFSQAFKKETGLSPVEYRVRYGAEKL